MFFVLLDLCPTLRINYRRPKTLNSDIKSRKNKTPQQTDEEESNLLLFERTHFLLIELAQVSWSRDFFNLLVLNIAELNVLNPVCDEIVMAPSVAKA